MVLEGRIEPHQFALALMYRAVPSKASKTVDDGKKRLQNVFKDTTRRFHAIILCCDILRKIAFSQAKLFVEIAYQLPWQYDQVTAVISRKYCLDGLITFASLVAVL